MTGHRIDFDTLEWQTPLAGVRHKYLDQGGRRLRLVEYSREMAPHWCETGHVGYVLDGRMEIDYPEGTVAYGPGDGISIPAGHDHRHRARILSDRVRVFFVEDAR